MLFSKKRVEEWYESNLFYVERAFLHHNDINKLERKPNFDDVFQEKLSKYTLKELKIGDVSFEYRVHNPSYASFTEEEAKHIAVVKILFDGNPILWDMYTEDEKLFNHPFKKPNVELISFNYEKHLSFSVPLTTKEEVQKTLKDTLGSMDYWISLLNAKVEHLNNNIKTILNIKHTEKMAKLRMFDDMVGLKDISKPEIASEPEKSFMDIVMAPGYYAEGYVI